MRKYLLATTALLMFATPAVAKDHSGYVGLEGGLSLAQRTLAAEKSL